MQKYYTILFILLFGFVFSGIFNFGKDIQAVEFLPTYVEVQVACGDGWWEISTEACDPGIPAENIPPAIGTSTCLDFLDLFGNYFNGGTLGCQDDCSDFATSSCYMCGNNYKEQVEECDGADFGGATCITWGFSGGSLACTSDCRISTANCEIKESEGGVSGSGRSGGGAGSISPGYVPGAEEDLVTTVVMRGKSYPNADVHVLVDGKVVGIIKTDNRADFYFETDEITPGVASFGFWSEDTDGLKSTTLSLTLRVISGAVTTISGVNIAPSIDVDRNSVRQGEVVNIYGQSVPETKINIHIHSDEEFVEEANSDENGKWTIAFDTTPLEIDFHTAKALFLVEKDVNVIKSGFSKAVSFHVGKVGGEAACPEADLNHDGRVNLTDFSILLFYWNTDNECADQNQNGNVDLVDFSIMMYYWTG